MSGKKNRRSETREELMKMLYQMEIQGDFSEEAKQAYAQEHLTEDYDAAYFEAAFEAYIKSNNEIDDLIEKSSRGWKLERISKTALAVLRCALCEILYMDDIPDAAAINEAVELAKGYDEPDTVSFINGVLGSFMRGRAEKNTEN